MSRVLVLHAHPNPSRSRINVALAKTAAALEGVTVVDLYALYPRWDIDVEVEQRRLLEHDVIVLQFPFYWYSTPPLIKLWLDRVLEFGFAYGEGGGRLTGKSMLVATTAGGAESAYDRSGKNRFPIRTLLAPLEQTARLCGMPYLAPFVLFASLQSVDSGAAKVHGDAWCELLTALVDDSLDVDAALARELMRDAPLPKHS